MIHRCEEIFALDDRIRFVAFIDDERRLQECCMRPGLESYSTEEEDQKFYGIIPSIFAGAAEQRRRSVGPVDRVEVIYQKIDQAFLMVQGGILCITSPSGTIKAISQKLREKYPLPPN